MEQGSKNKVEKKRTKGTSECFHTKEAERADYGIQPTWELLIKCGNTKKNDAK